MSTPSSLARAMPLSLHSRSPPNRDPSEYDLQELEPRPDTVLFDQELPQTRVGKSESVHTMERPSSSGSWSWNERDSSSQSSSSKRKSRAMFAGPPPPIAASIVMQDRTKTSPNHELRRKDESRSRGLIESGKAQISSVLFDQGSAHPSPQRRARNTDSIWLGLRRRERAIEDEVQNLLDLQAAGLLAGLGAANANPSVRIETDSQSDTGSSTPTGTFYSTASSKSQMARSLYVPTRSTPEGNVVPVRQPPKTRTGGLKTARAGIRRSLNALAELKMEEDVHIETAISQRKSSLKRLDRLSVRKQNISSELKTLEEDEQEPLGKELRDLTSKYETVSEEIREMEEKLVGMRNRKRWLKEKMGDIKNKREAGLSGYRGALTQVDTEVAALLRRPTIQPLETESFSTTGEGQRTDMSSAGGVEFLSMVPERRTMEMARSWWEEEVTILKERKAQVENDQQALEDGLAVWREVMSLITEFESSLRAVMRSGAISPPPDGSAKGKEQAPPAPEEAIREQVPRMDAVVEELEKKMRQAEEKGWNLLICAIGAELEAFREAYDMLREVFQTPLTSQENGADGSDPKTSDTDAPLIEADKSARSQDRHYQTEDSDNEVPADLLVSHREDAALGSSPGLGPSLTQVDSANEVPPEFLGEHDSEQETKEVSQGL